MKSDKSWSYIFLSTFTILSSVVIFSCNLLYSNIKSIYNKRKKTQTNEFSFSIYFLCVGGWALLDFHYLFTHKT